MRRKNEWAIRHDRARTIHAAIRAWRRESLLRGRRKHVRRRARESHAIELRSVLRQWQRVGARLAQPDERRSQHGAVGRDAGGSEVVAVLRLKDGVLEIER